jgi:hypothetical protein
VFVQNTEVNVSYLKTIEIYKNEIGVAYEVLKMMMKTIMLWIYQKIIIKSKNEQKVIILINC